MKITYNEDWIAVCNFALSLIGRSQLTSLNDSTSDAAQVRTFLPQAIGTCCEADDWTFLRKTIKLAKSTKKNLYGACTYELPFDMATLSGVDTGEFEFRREGNLICTDSDTCTIRCTMLPQSPDVLPITFRNAISYYLAYLLAFPLTGDVSTQASALQTFQAMLLQAQVNDSRYLPAGGDPYWEDQDI